MATSKIDLIIPVYLNQRLVFDLVAMLQGGIATVTRVSESRQESSTLSGELSGGIGLSQALASLLKVDLSGALEGEGQGAIEHREAAERVHTPASLLFILRNSLIEQGLLRQMSREVQPATGEFVEFTAALRRNPLIDALDSLVQILDLVVLFTEPAKPARKGSKASSDGQGVTELKGLSKRLESLAASLKAGGTQDLVADLGPGGATALLTVEERWLDDPSLSNVVDGTVRVVGKVVRWIPENNGSISLLRKTAMSRVPPQLLGSLTTALEGLQEQHGFSVPEMKVEVEGPAFHVLPVAVFA